MTAPSLAAGADYVRKALGVEMQVGGVHESMGTHNLLLKLGAATYLEVIAINPEAPPPGRPRWFGMDRMAATPRLATWVAATSDIRAAPAECGRAERMTRGPYTWQLTIPADGRMQFDGVLPGMIQWESVHPATRLEERGCSLLKLEGFYPQPQAVKQRIQCEAFSVQQGAPALVAHIQTPAGARKLR